MFARNAFGIVAGPRMRVPPEYPEPPRNQLENQLENWFGNKQRFSAELVPELVHHRFVNYVEVVFEAVFEAIGV